MEEVLIYIDGAAKDNPGPAGIGVVFCEEEGEVFEKVSEYIGETTNNTAEYKALIVALERAWSFGARKVKVFSDSELLVKQLNHQYKVRSKGLLPLFKRVTELIGKFEDFKINHVLRAKNREANRLAKEASRSGGIGRRVTFRA